MAPFSKEWSGNGTFDPELLYSLAELLHAAHWPQMGCISHCLADSIFLDWISCTNYFDPTGNGPKLADSSLLTEARRDGSLRHRHQDGCLI